MKQETGSNNSSKEQKISVKLPAGGDLFVIAELEATLANLNYRESSAVRVELLTKRVMLIPTTLLHEHASDNNAQSTVVERELSRGGINYYHDEEVIILQSGNISALVVVPKALVAMLEEQYGAEALTYDVPILRGAINDKRHMLLDTAMGITTIKLFKGEELQFADVYETPTDAAAVYWVQRVAAAMQLNETAHLYIYRCSGTVRRLLQRTFKKIMVCG